MSEKAEAQKAREIVIQAYVEALGGQLKRARVEAPGLGTFHIFCDEPKSIGGTDSAPAPLQYLVAALGFCLLTQLERYSHALKVPMDGASVQVIARFSSKGSALAGDIESGCEAMEMTVALQSGHAVTASEAERLLDVAERACYVTQSLRKPVPVSIRALLNGHPLELSNS